MFRVTLPCVHIDHIGAHQLLHGIISKNQILGDAEGLFTLLFAF